MNIICIGPAFPLRGGIADFNEELARTLVNQGDSVSIVSYSMQYPSILFPGKTQLSNSSAPKNLKISTMLHSLAPWNWRKVAKFVVAQQPDLVIIHYWMPFFAPALGTIAKKIKLNSNAKIIGICHNLIPHETKPGDSLLTKYFTKHCDAFIGMSKSVITDILKFAPEKPAIFSPHPMYSNFGESISKHEACKKLGLQENYTYVLFFGLIRKYKGLDLLLEAFADKRIKDLGIKLLIAGEFYDKPEYYTEIIKKNKIEHNVIIRNEFIPHDEVRYYFSVSDIVAQTYHSATQSGITQIAFHFNLPMLVTNVGGLSEIVLHNSMGYVCEKEPIDIANSIVDFFTNNKKAQFSLKVSQEKEKYSWEKFVKNLKKITI